MQFYFYTIPYYHITGSMDFDELLEYLLDENENVQEQKVRIFNLHVFLSESYKTIIGFWNTVAKSSSRINGFTFPKILIVNLLFQHLGKYDDKGDSDSDGDGDGDGIRAKLKGMGFSSEEIRNVLAKYGIFVIHIFCRMFSFLPYKESSRHW